MLQLKSRLWSLDLPTYLNTSTIKRNVYHYGLYDYDRLTVTKYVRSIIQHKQFINSQSKIANKNNQVYGTDNISQIVRDTCLSIVLEFCNYKPIVPRNSR